MNGSSAFLVTIYVANPKKRLSRAYCSANDSDFQDIRDCDTFSVMKFFQVVLCYLPFPLEPLFDLYIAFNNHSNSHNTAVIRHESRLSTHVICRRFDLGQLRAGSGLT